MSFQQTVISALTDELSSDQRVGLVFELAEALGVKDFICTKVHAETMAAEIAASATPEVNDGDIVMTSRGKAKALTITEQEHGLLRRLFEAADLAEREAA